LRGEHSEFLALALQCVSENLYLFLIYSVHWLAVLFTWRVRRSGLKEVVTTRAEHFCLDALQEKCPEWNIEINRRTRKRKKMPGEMAAGAGLTAVEETKGVMKSALDAVVTGLDTRFEQLNIIICTKRSAGY